MSQAAGGGVELGTDGFAAGERYHSARPDYPVEALDHLVESLRIDPGSHVVDLGAGSGIFTSQVVRYGPRITAVEPTAGMRRVLAGLHLPRVTVLEGRDVAIPLESGVVDQVLVAQAFHWFEPSAALAEIHRVLKPGGGLGLIWNERDESVDWVPELGAAMRWPERQPYQVGMDFRPVVAAGPFVDVERRQFRHSQVLDHTGLINRVLTTSYIAVMDPQELEPLLADVHAVVRQLPPRVELPYLTDVYRATAASAEPAAPAGPAAPAEPPQPPEPREPPGPGAPASGPGPAPF